MAVLVGLASTLPASGAEAAVARWTTHGPPGPVMASMALDPADPSAVYAGTSANGVFKTTSGGARWFAVSRGLPPTAHVYDLAIDPTRHDTLWAALGDAVFTSDDGGHSWREADSGVDHLLIVTLAVDPVDPDTVFAGGAGGLIGKVVYRTTDGGETWRNVSGSITSGSVEALAIDPSEHRTIYAGAGGGRVLYKSTDAGRTWKARDDGLPRSETVDALAIDPSDPRSIYAGTEFGHGVFRTVDGGRTWTPANGGAERTIYSMALDPTSPSTVYAGTVGGVLKTTDSGGHWDLVYDGGEDDDVRAVVIDPGHPATVYAGTSTEGGAFKTVDAGRSWFAVRRGLAGPCIPAVAVTPNEASIVYAADGGTHGAFKSTDGGRHWRLARTGITLSNFAAETIEMDPSDPDTLYLGLFGFPGGLFKTTDGAATWREADAGINAQAVLSVAVDPSRPSIVYAGADTVYRSRDGGRSWSRTGLDGTPAISALAVDPSAPDHLYAGTLGLEHQGGSIYGSPDRGASWVLLKALPDGYSVHDVAIDPANPDTLLASATGLFDVNGVLLRSTDAGATWRRIGGVGDLLPFAVTFDPANPGRVYLGTELGGVLLSNDGGVRWTPLNYGLTNRNVRDVAVAAGGSVLYAGTCGGGVFRFS